MSADARRFRRLPPALSDPLHGALRLQSCPFALDSERSRPRGVRQLRHTRRRPALRRGGYRHHSREYALRVHHRSGTCDDTCHIAVLSPGALGGTDLGEPRFEDIRINERARRLPPKASRIARCPLRVRHMGEQHLDAGRRVQRDALSDRVANAHWLPALDRDEADSLDAVGGEHPPRRARR